MQQLQHGYIQTWVYCIPKVFEAWVEYATVVNTLTTSLPRLTSLKQLKSELMFSQQTLI